MRECPSCGAVEKGNTCSFCEYTFVTVTKPIYTTPNTLTPAKNSNGKNLASALTAVVLFFGGIGSFEESAAAVFFAFAAMIAFIFPIVKPNFNKVFLNILKIILIFCWVAFLGDTP